MFTVNWRVIDITEVSQYNSCLFRKKCNVIEQRRMTLGPERQRQTFFFNMEPLLNKDFYFLKPFGSLPSF